MSDDTCLHEFDDGSTCGNAAGDDGYCYLDAHGPDPPDPDDSEKVVEAEGKALAPHEEKAVGKLVGLTEGARSESVQRKASADLLAHVRWKRERDDE
jgi:hypothetical protein